MIKLVRFAEANQRGESGQVESSPGKAGRGVTWQRKARSIPLKELTLAKNQDDKKASVPKRVVVISDLHSGHFVGLTPPEYDGHFGAKTRKYHFQSARRAYWDFYAAELDALQPIDVLMVNADCIDGKGARSGGTEQLTTDREEQVQMAADAIKYAKAKEIYMTFGTGYHVGDEEDWEDQVASLVGARKIGSHIWVNVNGLIFDLKHHISGSQTPTGRQTPLARERLWNILWSEWDEYPRSDILIRSHVHYHVYTGGYHWLAMTTPALQGYGTKFGARRMSGTVDFGFVHFDVVDKENYSWGYHILKSSELRATVYRAQ